MLFKGRNRRMNGVDDSSPVALAARPPSTHYSSSAGAPKLVLPATDGGMSRRELLHSLIGGKTDLQTAQFRVQRSFAEPPVHVCKLKWGPSVWTARTRMSLSLAS
jgi:hypothetical protein